MPRLRLALPLLLGLSLTGCGLGETAATGATTAELQAKQAAQAQQQKQQIVEQLDQANAQQQKRLDDAEKAAQ